MDREPAPSPPSSSPPGATSSPAPRRRIRRAAGVAALLVLVAIAVVIAVTVPDARPDDTVDAERLSPTASASPSVPGATILELDRIPWEGGPQYWTQFANAAEWTDPDFFPIGIWHGGIASADEVAWDKMHGINTYVEVWEGTSFSLIEDNDVYWVGQGLNDTFDPASLNWPGIFLSDEPDGRFSPDAGLAHLGALSDEATGTGKFRIANFTQLVIGSDLDLDVQESYVNEFTDIVSIDMYWYSIPFCDWRPYRGDLYAVPVPEDVCRTASSYGRALDALTVRDHADGRLQPRWQFIENLNGLSGHEHLEYISPGRLKGAAMSSIINEARGLLWFNQSFTGPCQSSNVVRDAHIEGDDWCGADQVAAMGEVNNLVHTLAPVINTQSYAWDFGSGLDTMLKVHDDHAYVFAMTDGTTGARTFTLPDGIDATSVEIIGVAAALPVDDGAFTDVFENEYDYRVYRIAL